MLELNRIYHQDCLEGMTGIADKSIDMILCDLPYGITRNKWDFVIPLDKLWNHYERIIKDNGAIVLTAQTPFDKILACSNLKLFKYDWVWQKTMAVNFLNAKKMPLRAHENVLAFYKKQPTYNPQFTEGKPYMRLRKSGHQGENYGFCKGRKSESDGKRFPVTIIKFPNGDHTNRYHPTQKPVALFEYLIKTYTNEGEVVLDNCMGSGTTAIACINTDRNFIGFETEQKYVDIANQRISDAQLKTVA